MFIQVIKKQTSKKTYKSVVLMENYRENGKVKHRIISNLTHCPEKIIEQLDSLIKGKSITRIEDLKTKQGKSCGGLIVANEIAKKLGIVKALGHGKNMQKALLLTFGRIFTQKSRLHIYQSWADNHAIEEVLQIKDLKLKDLYDNLDWLAENQEAIEKKLFKYRNKNNLAKRVFLYDVTSSYLEGKYNELGDYGYNRDNKKGKKQIVIGLLCDEDGYPISIEVFKGNTNDTKTVINQLEKLKKNFGTSEVIFVGDKGMISSTQIKDIQTETYRWDYITSISKPQIENLLRKNIFQLELFDNELVEVEYENIRYILRKNPVRAEEMAQNRESKINKIIQKINNKNLYLQEHPKAKPEVAQKYIQSEISKYKLVGILSCKREERILSSEIDQEQLNERSRLDGCYVIKTEVKDFSKESIHARYKDLALVESAFRTIKTTVEEIRPIHVRKEKRTRGHVFICMLAYMIMKYIQDAFKEITITRKDILDNLDAIQYRVFYEKKLELKILPDEYLEKQNIILNTLNIKLPKFL